MPSSSLCLSVQKPKAALLMCLPSQAVSPPCLSGLHLFPTTTWPDLAGGSPQLHGDLAAAGPHPVWHTGLQEALAEQKMTQNLSKKFLSQKKFCSCSSGSASGGQRRGPWDPNCGFPNLNHRPGQCTTLAVYFL